mmetsp:Transcript_13787/g.28466  ORF Transcript_13787/g.28466 Transcript_13787/m.28466 type:complete len:220 (+) Transcript_13787:48-707(+)
MFFCHIRINFGQAFFSFRGFSGRFAPTKDGTQHGSTRGTSRRQLNAGWQWDVTGHALGAVQHETKVTVRRVFVLERNDIQIKTLHRFVIILGFLSFGRVSLGRHKDLTRHVSALIRFFHIGHQSLVHIGLLILFGQLGFLIRHQMRKGHSPIVGIRQERKDMFGFHALFGGMNRLRRLIKGFGNGRFGTPFLNFFLLHFQIHCQLLFRLCQGFEIMNPT